MNTETLRDQVAEQIWGVLVATEDSPDRDLSVVAQAAALNLATAGLLAPGGTDTAAAAVCPCECHVTVVVATLSLPLHLSCMKALTAGLEAAYGPGLRMRQTGDVLEVIRR